MIGTKLYGRMLSKYAIFAFLLIFWLIFFCLYLNSQWQEACMIWVTGCLFCLWYGAAGMCVFLDFRHKVSILMVFFFPSKIKLTLFVLQVVQVCTNCGVNMGEYFCETCKFYDDNVIILSKIYLKKLENKNMQALGKICWFGFVDPSGFYFGMK